MSPSLVAASWVHLPRCFCAVWVCQWFCLSATCAAHAPAASITVVYVVRADHSASYRWRNGRRDAVALTLRCLGGIGQFPEIIDKQLALLIQQQIDSVLALAEERGTDEFVLVFKVHSETIEDRNFFASIIKSKSKGTVFEEYHLPVTLLKEIRPPSAIVTALKEKINRLLLHVQNDQTLINIIHNLKYSLTLER